MYHRKEFTQGGTLVTSTQVRTTIYTSMGWITKP
jgi:hypothetical protein